MNLIQVKNIVFFKKKIYLIPISNINTFSFIHKFKKVKKRKENSNFIYLKIFSKYHTEIFFVFHNEIFETVCHYWSITKKNS